MSDELKWDMRFLALAELVASWSKDPSTKTGAVLVAPDRRVIALGFNGFPRPMSDALELYSNREEKYSRIVHSEMNALLQAREPVNGATLYEWPFLPCDRCAVHIIQAGVVRIVAPRLNTEAGARWEPTFVKTRQYCREAGVQVLELDNG